MVVGANDLGAPLGAGFAGDASSAIPDPSAGLIPEDADTAAPSEWVDDDAAASGVIEDPLASAEDPQAAIRAEVEQALRAQIDTEWQTKLREFQSRKDRETAQARNHAQQVESYNQALLQHYVQRMTEVGVEQAEIERDLDAVLGRTQRAQQQRAQQSQSVEADFRSWATDTARNMQAKMAELSKGANGEVLFDPQADPEIQALTRQYFQLGQQYFLRGQDPQIAQQFNKVYQKHYDLLNRRREAAITANLTKGRNAAAQRQQQARATQQQRGPQVTVAGAGAGPLTDRQLKAAAEAEAVAEGLDPIKNQNEIFVRYLMKKRNYSTAGD